MIRWDRYSERSRRKPGEGVVDVLDREIEVTLLRLLAARGPGGMMTMSEGALAVGGDDWRGLLERVRRVAVKLALEGVVEFVWEGRAVDPSDRTSPGLIRLKGVEVWPAEGGRLN
jgi:hypothetical protein